jgi:hypothetical protein
MKKFWISVLASGLMCAGVVSTTAQTSVNGAGSAGQGSANLAAGTVFQAELSKSIDSKKAKSGDEVSAKLIQDVRSAEGKVILQRGAKLVGHVTEAQAKNKDNAEAKLGIVFDKAVAKGGQQIAFNGIIQAMAPPVQGALTAPGDENNSVGSGMGSGGNAMGGGRSGSGSMAPMGGGASSAPAPMGSGGANAPGSTANSSAGTVNGRINNNGSAAAGALNNTSKGVVGMPGVALNTASNGNAQASIISSANNNVKLESGTQIMLQVSGLSAAK